MNEESFFQQLGKSIQAWLWVELEVYFIYAAIMDNANQHLVSVTFNHIESFESKLTLIDRCLKLILKQDSEEYKRWKKLRKKAKNLNLKRNKIVHEPVCICMQGSDVKSIYISPSFFNALALVKGHTSHSRPVITAEYKPSQAKVLDEHKVDFFQLRKIESSFKIFSNELSEFKKSIAPIIKRAHKSVKLKKNKKP